VLSDWGRTYLAQHTPSSATACHTGICRCGRNRAPIHYARIYFYSTIKFVTLFHCTCAWRYAAQAFSRASTLLCHRGDQPLDTNGINAFMFSRTWQASGYSPEPILHFTCSPLAFRFSYGYRGFSRRYFYMRPLASRFSNGYMNL